MGQLYRRALGIFTRFCDVYRKLRINENGRLLTPRIAGLYMLR